MKFACEPYVPPSPVEKALRVWWGDLEIETDYEGEQHTCRHCLEHVTLHGDDGKCLFAPTSFESLKEETEPEEEMDLAWLEANFDPYEEEP